MPQPIPVLSSRIIVHPAEILDAMRRCEALGLQRHREWGPKERPIGVTYFLGGGGILELSSSPGAAPNGVTLWLQVPDVEEEARRLREHRYPGQIGEPALRPWGLIECWVELFDGIDVILVEIPEDHPLRRR